MKCTKCDILVKKDEVEANLEELLFGEVNFTSKDAKGKSQQIQSTDEEVTSLTDLTKILFFITTCQ